MQINIQDSDYKDLKKIDKSEAIKIIQTIKKLEDYRVLFDIEDEKIIVSNIKHRKEAY
jgi:mRNA interferase RelE/StbE